MLLPAELTLNGQRADLPTIIEFVESACRAAGIAPDRRFDLVLAVEEAATNVFDYAYRGRAGPLTLRLAAMGRDLHITLIDHGAAFDPAAIAPPDLTLPLEARPVGGLGLHLIRRLMDDVRYTFTPTANTLALVARDVLPAGPPAGERADDLHG